MLLLAAFVCALPPPNLQNGWAGTLQERQCLQTAGDEWGASHSVALLDARSIALGHRRPCQVVDIGAHHGTVALMAAELGCEVWTFEINPKVLTILRRNIELSGCADRIHLFTHEPADSVVPETVHPTLVKIDVDGADLAVAAGAMRLLNRTLAANFELSLSKRGSLERALDIVQLYGSAGLQVYNHWYKGPETKSMLHGHGHALEVGYSNASHFTRGDERNFVDGGASAMFVAGPGKAPPGSFALEHQRPSMTGVPITHPFRALLRTCVPAGAPYLRAIDREWLESVQRFSSRAEIDAFAMRPSLCKHHAPRLG